MLEISALERPDRRVPGAHQPSSLTKLSSPRPVRGPVLKKKIHYAEETTPKVNLWPPYVYIHAYTPTHTCVYTHKRKISNNITHIVQQHDVTVQCIARVFVETMLETNPLSD